jgi:hypothetical protein
VLTYNYKYLSNSTHIVKPFPELPEDDPPSSETQTAPPSLEDNNRVRKMINQLKKFCQNTTHEIKQLKIEKECSLSKASNGLEAVRDSLLYFK